MNELLEIDRTGIWHPYTPTPHRGPKALFTRSEGAFVWDQNGKRYYDGTSSWWCNTHGHRHPRLIQAIHRQLDSLDQVMFAPHTHAPAISLTQKLLQRLPQFQKVFYSDNGSTSVEVALKMALQYFVNLGKPRTKFMALERAYHGDTFGTMAVSHVDEFHSPFKGLSFDVKRAPIPTAQRSEEECLKEILKFIDLEGDNVAALIVEPLVLGAGGMLMYSKSYLEKLVEACQAKKILAVFDEVFTGFGRTGPFFAFEQTTCVPDLICLSKGLTGGMMALGATVVKEELFQSFEGGPFFHGHTFTANPIACAVAAASLDVFQEENTIERNGALIKILEDWVSRFRARHLGMILAVDIKEKNAAWGIAENLWEKGIWLRPLGDMIYVLPPYCTTQIELEWVLSELYGEVRTVL